MFHNMAISPKDFGALFKGFLDQMSATAPAEEPLFRKRLREHFGQDPEKLPTLAEKFAPYDHANLHIALESVLSDADCSVATYGMIAPHEYMGVTLSMLVAPAQSGLWVAERLTKAPWSTSMSRWTTTACWRVCRAAFFSSIAKPADELAICG